MGSCCFQQFWGFGTALLVLGRWVELMIPFGKALCFWLQIRPWVKQIWPPEGDNRVTNMDVVFFSDLEGFDREGAARESPLLKPGETWLQKGHAEVCWPQQWLPEDLGSNVRIFEIRSFYFPRSTVVSGHSVETTALRQLNRVAEQR